MKILLVEDENDLSAVVSDYFVQQDAIVIISGTKFEAEDALITNQFDIVFLDIGLPDGSGLELIPAIRGSQENAGILIVSAKNSLDDKVDGLDLGADDYITKPFHLAELNSRVKALMRRKQFKGKEIIQFQELSINISENQAYVHDQVVPLTKKEFSLLIYFIVNNNRVLTKEAISEHLWKDNLDFADNYNFIYTHIKNLRKKILIAGGKDYLSTVHGIGYKYTIE